MVKNASPPAQCTVAIKRKITAGGWGWGHDVGNSKKSGVGQDARDAVYVKVGCPGNMIHYLRTAVT